MKNLITILCLSWVLFSQLYSNELRFSESSLYVSPGLHIGINSNMEIFYGFQISIGLYWLYTNYSLPQDFNFIDILESIVETNVVSTSLSVGYKKIPKNNKYSSYRDFQVSHFHIKKNNFVMLGFGQINYGDGSDGLRSKFSLNKISNFIYPLPGFLYDYEFKNKNHNISLFGVLPITPEP